MCVQKRNYGYTFILQTTKPIFKSIPEHYSEHYFLQVTFRHTCLSIPLFLNTPTNLFLFLILFCFSVQQWITQLEHHPSPPPSPPLLKGGRTFRKMSHQGRNKIFCQKDGIRLKRGGERLMQKWGRVATFLLLCSSVTFTLF